MCFLRGGRNGCKKERAFRLGWLTRLLPAVQRFCVDLLMKNDKIVGRTLPACLRPSDMNSITVLSIPELDFRVPFSLIVKRGRKLNAREQLFKHMILDCYR